jgi:hypothetical protein
MFKNFKSAVVAPALVLATANAAMAANEYHLKCESESGPTMRASASPTQYHNRELTMCGYTMYIDGGTDDHIVYCLNNGEDVITYWHSNYSQRLCTVRG